MSQPAKTQPCPLCSHPVPITGLTPQTRIPCPSCGCVVQVQEGDLRVHGDFATGNTLAQPAGSGSAGSGPRLSPPGGVPPTTPQPRPASAGEGQGQSPIPGYVVLEELGRGGMAVVFKAQQQSLDRIVALKIMSKRLASDPDFVKRFEREAKALAKLNHPNITSVYDRGQAGEKVFFVMEYVEGPSLRDILEKSGGRLPQDRALPLFIQVAEALAYVHDRGTIHRDIKPENVLVTADEQVKVTDFGLAAMADRQINYNLTAENMMMGTLNYMPPEQRADAKSVDHRADIYSFGVMLYEVLTGTVPLGKWQAASELVPELDPRLDHVIASCLQNRREDRYQSIIEARDALIEVRDGPPASSELNIPLMGAELLSDPGGRAPTPPPASHGPAPAVPAGPSPAPRRIQPEENRPQDLEALVAQAKRNMVAQRTRGLPTKVHNLPGIDPPRSRLKVFLGSLVIMLALFLGGYFLFEGAILVRVLVHTGKEDLQQIESPGLRNTLVRLRSWSQGRARSLCLRDPRYFLPPLNSSDPDQIRVALVILSRGKAPQAATMAGTVLYSEDNDVFGWAVRALQYQATHNPRDSEITQTALSLLNQATINGDDSRVSFLKGVIQKIRGEQSVSEEAGA